MSMSSSSTSLINQSDSIGATKLNESIEHRKNSDERNDEPSRSKNNQIAKTSLLKVPDIRSNNRNIYFDKDSDDLNAKIALVFRVMDSVGSFCCPFAIQRKIQILSQYSLSYDMPLTERLHVIRIAISIAYRAAIEMLVRTSDSSEIISNLWVSLRKKGCQYLGPAIQEEILKLIILALGDDAQLTRKVLTLYILQKIDKKYCSKATKTSVGHVVQILYRSNCFKLIKRKNDSCLMQLKKEFENYEDLRRKHDKEIIEIAIEDGIRLSPGQWSSLLYGDTKHKSQMQSILDKVNAKDSFELLALSLEDIDAKYFEHLDPQERRQFQLFQNLIPLISINDEESLNHSLDDDLFIAIDSASKIAINLMFFISNIYDRCGKYSFFGNPFKNYTVRCSNRQSDDFQHNGE